MRRLCWACALAAAVAIGPGYALVPFAPGGERPKSSVNFWPGAKEARRLEAVEGVGGGEFSLDMAACLVQPGDVSGTAFTKDSQL